MMKRIYNLILLLMVLTVFTACQNTEEYSKERIETIGGKELEEIQRDVEEKEKYLVIDIRTPEEYEAGHIIHAINIPADELKESMDVLKERPEQFITICNTQNRSAKTARFLEGEGMDVLDATGVKNYSYTMVKHHNLLIDDFLEQANQGNETRIIDAREKEDYLQGHLKNAIHWEDEKIQSFYKEKDQPIFIYCYAGNASGELAEEFVTEGFTKVYSCLDGTKESEKFQLITE